ncbi:uncharacterized protein TM35_000071950 [Trypanosoma theileri]|uniref:Uncharacterized protein n=1 Tax=Trypanosoma theileri TaxID=67003 RepID=A0A1X0P1Q5_9TRYP|nr:uncharacterized protein TM35_000071950 [Trypanosoma theileri]ORC90771.1 hypothetical protein TM35_000071950 [Trypanosoma theileri]
MRILLGFVILIAAIVTSVLFAGVSIAQSNECTQGTACQPWNASKRCAIGQRMDLRYGVQLSGGGSMLAFGFCPLVDELQAFNLSGVGTLLSSIQGSGNASLIVYGQGAMSAPTTDFSNAILYAEVSDKCKTDELAVVSFLLLRLPMTEGHYTYASNTSYPESAGFESTCSENGQCPYSEGSVCIGPSNNTNCAKCYKRNTLTTVQTTIWASYYGTDSGNKIFKSGESNPAHFRKFSIGVLETMSRIFDR